MPEIICKCLELFSRSLIIIVTKFAGINVKHIDINIFNGLMGYSFYIFLSDFVDQLNTNVDKFLLAAICKGDWRKASR